MNKHNLTASDQQNVPSEINKAVGLAIVGVTVIDIFTGSKAVQDVLIKGEKIVQMGLHGTLDFSADIQTINAHGKYVIPGLCDMHAHMTIWPEFTDRISTLFITNGITSVRDMGGQLDDILAFRKQASQRGAVAPRLWIAGPIIDGSPRILEADPQLGRTDISVLAETPEEAADLVDQLVEHDIDFVKAYEMLRPDVFTALLKRAQTHQLPAAGHLPIRMTIPQVLDVGPYDIQHLGGVCSGMKFESVTNPQHLLAEKVAILDKYRPEESGMDLAMKVLTTVPAEPSKQDSNRLKALIETFVEKDIWHTPTLVTKIRFNALGGDDNSCWLKTFQYLPKVRQIQSQVAREKNKVDPNTEAWNEWTLKTVSQMHEAGVNLLAGTDCPPTPHYTPGFGLHYELKVMVLAGLSPLSALQTATINPARFFNLTDDLGSITVGKYADMVLLNADPLVDINNTQCIEAVVSRGQFFERQVLDDMLENIVER